MTITLTPEQETFVRERVVSGEYKDAETVLSEALHLLIESDLETNEGVDNLRKSLEEGYAELRRGEGIRFDDKESFVNHLTQQRKKRRTLNSC